VKEPVEHPYAP